MIRRRNAFLAVLALISFCFLYLTILLKKEHLSTIYTHLVTSTNIRIRSLSEVTLPISEEQPRQCSNGTLVYDVFCVLSPYDDEVRRLSDVGAVTLCTQGTVEFLRHVAVLCHRWSGPVSVAVYSPREDYVDARITVHMLRQCNACVRHWVNWHFFYPSHHELPYINEFQLTRDCVSISQVRGPKKRRSRGIYPINVGRNLARQFARTPFVFSTDIELYPSLDIPAKFDRMLRSQVLSSDNQVWVVPVFEVHSRVRAPFLKSQLRKLYDQKLAISFHRYRCNICHKIPNLTQWMALGSEGIDEVEDSLEPLKVWTTVKRSRQFKLQEWEPFFIGTTKDPEFDIRLSWEGKQNKMQLAYEMCMRNYDFHIVENAFLIHSPGINVYNATKEKERAKYMYQNRKVISMVRKQLIHKYGFKSSCG